jgi:uncharacterized membrane protein
MTAVLLYTAPLWLWYVIAFALVAIFGTFFAIAAAQIDNEHDEEEARIVQSFIVHGRPRW